MKIVILILALTAAVMLFILSSCQHDIIYHIPDVPVDTTHLPIDTVHVPVDTMHCDTCAAGVISFSEDVLPILQSNCALTGCHDAITHKENLNTTSYTAIMSGSKRPTSLTGDFYKSISGGGGDQMPPPPNPPLSSQQLSIIRQWIQQGSQNTTCSHICSCDTLNVSFASNIYPTIQTYCLGCHNSGSSQGGVNLAGYSNVLVYVSNGKLMKSIKHETGVVAMPYNAAKLNDCTISKFQSWINAGALNN